MRAERTRALYLSELTFLTERGAVNTSRQGYKMWEADKRNTRRTKCRARRRITADAVNAFIEGARTGKMENAAFYAADSTLTAITELHR